MVTVIIFVCDSVFSMSLLFIRLFIGEFFWCSCCCVHSLLSSSCVPIYKCDSSCSCSMRTGNWTLHTHNIEEHGVCRQSMWCLANSKSICRLELIDLEHFWNNQFYEYWDRMHEIKWRPEKRKKSAPFCWMLLTVMGISNTHKWAHLLCESCHCCQMQMKRVHIVCYTRWERFVTQFETELLSLCIILLWIE